ncbi:MAG: PAS domain S-box protein [Anaerolineales bacterium]
MFLNIKKSSTSHILWLIFFGGIVLSILVSLWVFAIERNIQRREFEDQAVDFANRFNHRIEDHIKAVDEFTALYTLYPDVKKDAFLTLASQRFNSVATLAIEWAPLVKFSERAKFEEANKLYITERDRNGQLVVALERPEYFPVYFIEPLKGNEAALGFDLASETVRYEALQKAKETGESVATASVDLIQKPLNPKGILLFGPVFSPDPHTSNQIRGMVVVVIWIKGIVESELNTNDFSNLQVVIEDSTDGSAHEVLYRPEGDLYQSVVSNLMFQRQIEVKNRQWLVTIYPSKAFLNSTGAWLPWIVLGIGLFFTVCITTIYKIQYDAELKIKENNNSLAQRIEEKTAQLQFEIQDRIQIEEQMRQLNMKLEDRVKEKTVQLKQALEAGHIGTWEWNMTANVVQWSDDVEKIFNLPPNTLDKVSTSYLNLIHPEDRSFVEATIMTALENNSEYHVQHRTVTSDGVIRWWEIDGRVFPGTGMFGTVRDVTERKKVEDTLRHSQLELQDFLNSANDLIQSINMDGAYIYVNRAWCERLGYKEDEAMHLNMFDVIHPDYQEHCMSVFQKMTLTGQAQFIEVAFRTKNGEKVVVEGYLNARMEDGKVVATRGIFRDITRRKQAEEALVEREKSYRIAIAAADAVPYSLDYETNTYLFVGEGIQKLTGYTDDEMTPQLFASFVQETKMYGELSDVSPEEATALLRNGQANSHVVWRCDYLILNRNGEYRWLSDSAVQVRNNKGMVTGSLGILQDVTERKKAEETLHLANKEMERVLQMKDEFLANMSHELRTPLNAILGISESLFEEVAGTLNHKQKKYVQIINESGRHLLDLINDILDLSKVESGHMELQRGVIDVEFLCQASLRIIKELAQKKSLQVSYQKDENAKFVMGDERRLKQSLVNLLSNAVKFTPVAGSIGLVVSVDEVGRKIKFTVWDKGIGIPQEKIPLLFQPFIQLNGGLDREHGGTGLGLALVSKMIQLQGGFVSVESEVGSGSKFLITLPWSSEEFISISEKIYSHSVTSVENKYLETGTVLLVEDTDSISSLVSDYLTVKGYTVIKAKNGKEGVSLALINRPDIILMDVMMPLMDGLEATRKIREDVSMLYTPIIGVTALAMPGDHEKCIEAGMTSYISKPVELKKLTDLIRKYLGNQNNKSEME